MSDPEFHFDNEELTLDISNLGGGWSFGQLSEIRLFDHAQVQFPHGWDDLKIGAATHIIDLTWNLHAHTFIEGTLTAGMSYTRADGVSGDAGAEAALVQHILQRPTVTMDFRATVKLDGTVNENGFSGTPNFGLSLSGRF